MNRKLYEENQQYKERTCEQRQQVESLHMMLQQEKSSKQQQSDSQMSALRKELERESGEKRRMQAALESKQQEAMQAIAAMRASVDEMREREARLLLELQQERSNCELTEKKCKIAEKEVLFLKENGELERRQWDASRKQALLNVEVRIFLPYLQYLLTAK